MLSGRCLSCLSVCLSVLSVCNVGVLWPNGWMHQDETWHGGRPRPRPHCVRLGSSSPHTERGTAVPSSFRPIFVVVKRLDGSRCTRYGGRRQLRPHCVRWDPAPPPPERYTVAPTFRPMFIVVKRLDGSKCHLVRR